LMILPSFSPNPLLSRSCFLRLRFAYSQSNVDNRFWKKYKTQVSITFSNKCRRLSTERFILKDPPTGGITYYQLQPTRAALCWRIFLQTSHAASLWFYCVERYPPSFFSNVALH
jgi:hypothetical protein